MAKHTPKSRLGKVLNNGGGGLSGQTAPTQPLPLLAQGESLTHSLQSAQAEPQATSTHRGDLQSSNGAKPVLTEPRGSTTPKSTLAGTLNWSVRMLAHRQLAKVEEVRDEDGALEGYVVRLSAENWVLTPDNLLALKDTEGNKA